MGKNAEKYIIIYKNTQTSYISGNRAKAAERGFRLSPEDLYQGQQGSDKFPSDCSTHPQHDPYLPDVITNMLKASSASRIIQSSMCCSKLSIG